MTKKKLLALVALLGMVISAVFAQDAVTRALDLLNKSMILNDTEKAYSYARFVCNYYEGEEMPYDAEEAVKKAVNARAKELEANQLWDSLITMEEEELNNAPKSVQKAASSSIKKAHAYFEEVEEKKAAKKEEEKRMIEELKQKEAHATAKAERDEDTEKFLKIIEQQTEIARKNQEAELAARDQFSKMMKEMNETSSAAISKVSSNNLAVMAGFGFLILVFIALIIFVVFVMIRATQKNQEQMQNTILTMQAMRIGNPGVEALPPGMAMMGGRPMMLEASAAAMSETAVAPDGTIIAGDAPVVTEAPVEAAIVPDEAEKQLAKINQLLDNCRQFAVQVDSITGRKNCSERVGQLVRDISLRVGLSEDEATLNYAAGLVYDIGFLNVNSELFKADTLTQDQFELIKSHTTIGPNMVFFADEAYREIFKQAAGMHHENLDGSGYPMGLRGDEIPFIARAIRVAESYIALVSRRQYHDIRDRDEAIQELRDMKGKYDEALIDALEQIV